MKVYCNTGNKIDISKYVTKESYNSQNTQTNDKINQILNQINSINSQISLLGSKFNQLSSQVTNLLERVAALEENNVPVEPEPPESPEPPENPTKPCTGISINKYSHAFSSKGDTLKLNAVVTPTDTTDEIFWQSSNPSVATVSNNGLVTAVSNGSAIITVSCGSHNAKCSISVNIIVYYSITNRLNNMTSNNPISTIEKDKSYNAELVCAEDYEIESVKLTMNDVDVTSMYCKIEENTVEENYENPTLSVEGIKIKAEKNGKVQYFDASSTLATGHPSYAGYLTVEDDDSNTYYVALLHEGSSIFTRRGKYIDSGGWYSVLSSKGEDYKLKPSVLSTTNFTGNIPVVNSNIPNDFLNRSLELVNQSFPSLNYFVVESTGSDYDNVLSIDDFEDTWYGLCTSWYNQDTGYFRNFTVQINNSQLKNYGEYGGSKTQSNPWLSTFVHELGHPLGTSDYPAHLPSLYDYGRNRYSCIYLQPNDIAWIEYLCMTVYGVDITTTQENIANQIAMLSLDEDSTISKMIKEGQEVEKHAQYDYDCDLTRADIVVKCKLNYRETKKINISKNNIFELEYHIYDIIDCNGELNNLQLKIPAGSDFVFNKNYTYELYLKQFENTPCSLLDPNSSYKILSKED